MGIGNRGRHYHGARAGYMRRIVPEHDLGTTGDHVLRARQVGITPRDHDTPATRQYGQGAHPRATDPHEVHRTPVGRVE
jgi:hypothetical protein